MIKSMGYADEVLLDEVHAYFGVDGEWFKNNKTDLLNKHNVGFPDTIHKKLLDLYKRYTK